MKKTFILLGLISIVIFGSCDPKKSKEYIAATQKADSLEAVVTERDADVKAVFDALNEIEDNLSAVRSRFQTVDKMKKDGGNEVTKDVRARITAEITDLNDILAQNKKRLGDLSRQLSKSNTQMSELNQYIEKLESRINEQDEQIYALSTDLSKKENLIVSLNRTIVNLEKSVGQKDTIIVKKERQINTAYYIIGTRKQLTEANIVDKKGGFIGIGGQYFMNRDANTEKFTKIDIDQTRNISIPSAKKVKIITTHPNQAYEMSQNPENKYDAITVKNPSEFWRVSKYLVIMID